MKTSMEELRRLSESTGERLSRLTSVFRREFACEPTIAVSAPGRTELIGNHTDHNAGMVVAAAIDRDVLGVICPRTDRTVRLWSQGYGNPFTVDLEAVAESPAPGVTDTELLIQGVAVALAETISGGGSGTGVSRGFDAAVESTVLPGSGLSSSAAFENFLTVALWAANASADSGGAVPVQSAPDAVTIAKVGQVAENRYMGKPSGLMDQLAGAHGGAIAIDFESSERPVITPLRIDFRSAGFRLAVVNTGGTHADLTDAYASVPRDMHAVATVLNATTLRELDPSAVIQQIPDVRSSTSDQAILRTMHFFAEQRRVHDFTEAAQRDDVGELLRLMVRSGRSSAEWLQNVLIPGGEERQPIALALAMTEWFVENLAVPAAYRVHGGGFGGTILVVVPDSAFESYRSYMEHVYGPGAVIELKIRTLGCVYAEID